MFMDYGPLSTMETFALVWTASQGDDLIVKYM